MVKKNPNKRLTGEPTDPVQETINSLNDGWRKHRKSILSYCKDVYKAVLKHPRRTKDIVAGLDYERGVFNKLRKIGETDWLHEESRQKYLPDHYSLIWEYTKVSEADFDQKAKSGEIRPSLTRAEIKALLSPTPSSKAKPATAAKLPVKVDWSHPVSQTVDFKKWLRGGCVTIPGLEANWDQNDPYAPWASDTDDEYSEEEMAEINRQRSGGYFEPIAYPTDAPQTAPADSSETDDEHSVAEDEEIQSELTGNVSDFSVQQEAEMAAATKPDAPNEDIEPKPDAASGSVE